MSEPTSASYYGDPILHRPVWTAEIPWYFFTGGLAGASSALAVAARAGARPDLARLWEGTAAAGALVSPLLLVSDLGQPSRFLNMLRVFKPTSPMSMGSWLLATYAPAAIGAAVLDQLDRLSLRSLGGLTGGVAREVPRGVARGVAGLTGPGLATYTAVLIADTAVPVWHEGRHELPFVFAGSALASAGGAAVALAAPGDAAPGRRALALGAALELGAAQVMEHRLGVLGDAYRQAPARSYRRGARALTVAGAALALTAGRTRRPWAVLGGVMTMAGSVCERFSVFRAGFVSADDPAATVAPQRRGLNASS